MPLEWIDFREAVRVYYLGQVAYSYGSVPEQVMHRYPDWNVADYRTAVVDCLFGLPPRSVESRCC